MSEADRNPKLRGAGESQGGAYPNPHDGKDPDGDADGFLGHGGQSRMGYSGPDNPNATKEDEGTSDEQ